MIDKFGNNKSKITYRIIRIRRRHVHSTQFSTRDWRHAQNDAQCDAHWFVSRQKLSRRSDWLAYNAYFSIQKRAKN